MRWPDLAAIHPVAERPDQIHCDILVHKIGDVLPVFFYAL